MSGVVTEFVAIRHGQTAENASHVLQGHLDTGLDATGWRQAAALAARLRQEGGFDRLVCSDLRRARETAGVLGAALSLPLELEPALREWNLGVLQGHSRFRLDVLFPDVVAAFTPAGGDVVIPGGESRRALECRVTGCLERLLASCSGERLLLVTHGGALRALFRYLSGETLLAQPTPATDNAGYSHFCHQSGRWRLTCWNDTAHLAAVASAPGAVATDETVR